MTGLEEKTVQKEGKGASLKQKRKWPYVAAAVLLVFIAAGLLLAKNAERAVLTISPTDTAKLVRGDLQDSISTTGTVESAKSMTVYSTKAYTVQEVLVEVGDRVEEGQLLCKLDDQNIQNQIESQQASLEASTNSSNAAIASAKDNYQQFKESLEKGTNASIISAENAVTNALNAYQTAQQNYDRYLAGLNAGENTTILAQETALSNARKAVEKAYEAFDDAVEAEEDAEEALDDAEEALEEAEEDLEKEEKTLKKLEDEQEDCEEELEDLKKAEKQLQAQLDAAAEEAEKSQLQLQLSQVQQEIQQKNLTNTTLAQKIDQAKSACLTAELMVAQQENTYTQYEKAWDAAEAQIEASVDAIATAEENLITAQKQYNAALTSVDNLLADYAKNVETTYQAYQTAQASLTAAKVSAQNQLQTYENSLNSAYANAGKGTLEVSLRQLQAELDGTQITAPMTGTVTAVYAEVGSAGSGLLFVIEDTENFVIATSVKDYDITSVALGTEAMIRSDATGDDLYEGKVTYLAPTANKTAMGVTDTSGDISFDADVKVNSRDTKLRIGLNVRLELIVAEEEDVLAAPYDAIYQNSQGNSCVLIAQEQEDGLYLLREEPVELGLETDLDIAVKADGLTDGMTVVCSPEQYLQYIGQKIAIGTATRQGLLGGK